MLSLLATVVSASALIATTVSAASLTASAPKPFERHRPKAPTIIGTVTAINGSSLTLTTKDGKVYTVNDVSAQVTHGFGPNAQTLTVADIKNGDAIGVIGTISGTTVTASTIIDGWLNPNNTIHGQHEAASKEKPRPDMVGLKESPDHQPHTPLIHGTITALSGNTLTINVRGEDKNTSITPYSVTTTNSTLITKDGQNASLSDLSANQMVIVEGTLNTANHTMLSTKINIITKKPMGLKSPSTHSRPVHKK